ncbi:MAG: branched-chain amino acid ABC transporter permease [Chloroflexales bacterium]|nr:branched-chain amino acid ABC transporter permease [Chloroflexales bacterium]
MKRRNLGQWIVGIVFLLALLPLIVTIATQIVANPQLFSQQLFRGLVNGAIIAIVALGYTLVYGIVELINFAHGDVFMLGSFTALIIVGVLNVAGTAAAGVRIPVLVLTLVVAMVVTAGINVAIERFTYRRLRSAPRLAPLISAIGMSFILQWVGLMLGNLNLPLDVMGNSPAASKNVPNLVSNQLLLEAPLRVTLKDGLVLVVSVLLMVGLYIFIQRTRVGKAMRATAQDRDAARLMGIDVDRTIALAFLLGGALAGAAGMIAAFYFNSAVFNMGFTYGLRSFTAAVLGGIGNIPGAMLGGVLIGVLAALSDQYISTRWTNAVVFAILVIILVFRPSGLLGEDVVQKA